MELTIHQLEARVKWHAGRLGLRLTDVAERMGFTTQHELSMALSRRTWRAERFYRLDAVLDHPDWQEPLPSLEDRASDLVRGMFRKGTRKRRAPEKTSGDQGPAE